MPSLPDNTPLSRLQIKPYAVEIFADLERGKAFATFHYRHKKPGTLSTQLALITNVVADLTRAGYLIMGDITPSLAPSFAGDGNRYRIHLKVSVQPFDAEGRVLEILRAHFAPS